MQFSSDRRISRSRRPGGRALALAVALLSAVLLAGCTSDDEGSDLDYLSQVLTASQLTDNGDGTITDTRTGLIWRKCAHGQVWNAGLNNCAGTGSETTYGAASEKFCEALLDYSTTECINESASDAAINPIANSGPAYRACNDIGYRLPTQTELVAFADGTDRATLLYTMPQTPDDKYFWTANGNPDDGDMAYGVSFAKNTFGQSESFNKAESVLYVRCVK